MIMKHPSTKDKNLAELIGILLGDGSIGIYKCKTKNKISMQHRVKITLNSIDDLDYSIFVSNLIQSLFGVIPLKRIRKNEKSLDLLCFNKDIVRFLIDDIGMALSPKWDRAKIPDFCFENNLELFALRGYFDTDGCVSIVNNNGKLYPRLEMKVCPSPMQQQFIDILRKHNFRFGAYKIGNGKVRIQMNGLGELKKWSRLVGFSNKKNIKRAKRFLVARDRFERSTFGL